MAKTKTKTNLELADDFRDEALRLYGLAHDLQVIAMKLDGTHFSLPDDLRATEAQRVARMPKEHARKLLASLERAPVSPGSGVDEQMTALLRARIEDERD